MHMSITSVITAGLHEKGLNLLYIPSFRMYPFRFERYKVSSHLFLEGKISHGNMKIASFNGKLSARATKGMEGLNPEVHPSRKW